ncbi:hypothetical protein VTJ04DRAFT_7670 [Mycothermus thermophilus]|uniref:uncharacterized protein n=1 Tax=Humicola insolens TaxID=85995 RepID=UPI003743757B
MPYKPLRQLAAEKALGTENVNPSQLGDPIDLKAETSNEPDPVETPHEPKSGDMGPAGGKYRYYAVAKSAMMGHELDEQGTEQVVLVGLGDGAGPIGGVVMKRGSKL